ncbi:hypothetical protein [Williamsoniiplasma lucivorax]|uniref:Uncharacterized protein n=1 Tax=Williamsoniiplasma lucivorax TaxID=209274 RepID=A0A2S5REL4_9MOLU|nr:hypothetical protein [Williamsoniiplasma lucivorax]PPE05769.1 hypothetical protein ELUCI_v1c00570 [Williamsoniiplasma lucivorax]
MTILLINLYFGLTVFCIFSTFICTHIYRQTKVIYNVFNEEINFSEFPLYLKTEKAKYLIYYFLFLFLSLLIFIIFTCWIFFWNKSTNEQIIVYFSISGFLLSLHVFISLWVLWKNNKLIWSKNNLYSHNDLESAKKLSPKNFNFNINFSQSNLISFKNPNRLMLLFYVPWFAWLSDSLFSKDKIEITEGMLSSHVQKCKKKLMKLSNKNKQIKELKIFVAYLKNVSLFILWMERLGVNSININKKQVGLNELKKVTIENFFYYKNLSQTQKLKIIENEHLINGNLEEVINKENFEILVPQFQKFKRWLKIYSINVFVLFLIMVKIEVFLILKLQKDYALIIVGVLMALIMIIFLNLIGILVKAYFLNKDNKTISAYRVISTLFITKKMYFKIFEDIAEDFSKESSNYKHKIMPPFTFLYASRACLPYFMAHSWHEKFASTLLLTMFWVFLGIFFLLFSLIYLLLIKGIFYWTITKNDQKIIKFLQENGQPKISN